LGSLFLSRRKSATSNLTGIPDAADNHFLVDVGFRETDPGLQKTVVSLMLEIYRELEIGVIRYYAGRKGTSRTSLKWW